MIWNLDGSGAIELTALPETGMGFQLVKGQLRGEAKLFLVTYAQQAVDISALGLSVSNEPEKILNNGMLVMEALKDENLFFSSPAPKSFRLVGNRIQFENETEVDHQENLNQISSTPSIATPSTLVKSEVLAAPRVYYRFSAYLNDKRIDPVTGNFTAGTYATTDSDQPMVPSGFAAVGRYALPNTQPASYRHEIEVAAGTLVYYGTVAPAFGQAGGGVEAVFPNGAVNIKPKTTPVKVSDE